MKTKQKLLATAVTAVFALGAAAPAAAHVYAGSHLSISNLVINFFDQDTGGQITNLNPGFTFNVEDSATLNGSTQAFADGCSSVANNCGTAPTPVLNVPAANAPGSSIARANGNYSLFGPGSETYANANAEISTAQLVNGVPTATQQVAEVELQGKGQAQASTNIQSNTSFTMNFALMGDGPAQLQLNFDANPELQALVATDGQGFAQANISANFTLNQLSGGSGFATWSPNGSATGNAICANGLTCSDEVNPESLNLTLGVGPQDGNLSHSLGVPASSFQLYVSGLTAGNYTLTLAALTSVNVTEVPAPGTLLLLGSGVLGLGLAGIRRRRQIQA
ncbi:EDSAP-1 family PEP-CTERM protein [Ectothiorhodospira lacustris]|uniref:EDSAP-1 family PEP-CTERM protein n=1 Tax=Ectothiorhodospira lacustris TaxID=2899127 RepID=UPI001EE83777|nr:EDSAP-1 family PEP-CTERM protein [Ectothiorhodospira lacustris]MCG5502073.1 PEP-CTERM sorting domain-containing protein [Ectothiorhodospira lacustris]